MLAPFARRFLTLSAARGARSLSAARSGKRDIISSSLMYWMISTGDSVTWMMRLPRFHRECARFTVNSRSAGSSRVTPS